MSLTQSDFFLRVTQSDFAILISDLSGSVGDFGCFGPQISRLSHG
jgi:hypothetical protein